MLRFIRNLMNKFERHHDERSVQRQRSIATLTIYADLIVISLYAIAIFYWRWQIPRNLPLQALAYSVFGIGLCLLTGASSLFRSAVTFFQGLGSPPADTDVAAEPIALMRARKYLFYSGIFANFTGFCFFVELTGGIVKSPFTPVLYTMILAAQQLGRFRTNSAIFIGFGVAATGILLLVERIAGVVVASEPPARLSYLVLASAFLITAIFTHSDKARNFRARGITPIPSSVELYRDGDGWWRYSLYRDRTRIDAPVSGANPGTSAEKAKQEIANLVAESCGAEISGIEISWTHANIGEGMMGRIARPLKRPLAAEESTGNSSSVGGGGTAGR